MWESLPGVNINNSVYWGSRFVMNKHNGIFLFTTASRTALGPTQPPIQWVPGVKQLGCEADNSLPFSAKVKV
jgi:hypothetical protein